MTSIVRSLYERYYEPGGVPEESDYLSSHWVEEGKDLLAERDDSGEIVPTSVYYWGCRWKSFLGRWFDAAHRYVHLPGISHRGRIFRISRISEKVCHRMGLDSTYNVFRQVCTAELLERHLRHVPPENKLRMLVIGDGTGVLSALLKEMFPSCSVTLVDMGKALLYQAYHCQLAHPRQVHSLEEGGATPVNADFLYCPTENLSALEKYDFDVAVNVASMQEMNAATIAKYFGLLRRSLRINNLFYCCNRESKTLIGGEISAFYNYPWLPKDQTLMEETCPWHRYIVGRYRAVNGPKIFGFRIPFLSYFDGLVLHRLAVLATERTP